jgi:hypothetical protein
MTVVPAEPPVLQETTTVAAEPPQPHADDEQDAADEAAETETTEDAPLTLDDARNAVQPYIKKWTMVVALQDVAPMIKEICGVEKISDIDPTNQEALRKLVALFKTASASDTRYVKAA